MRADLIFELLERALTEEMGLVVECHNPKRAQTKIDVTKQGIAKYKDLIITLPSTPNTIMIVKRSVDLEDYDRGEPGDLPDV